VTLQLSVKGKVVGTSTIENMTLRPGDNNLPMTAIIDQASVLEGMNPTTGYVDLEIIGSCLLQIKLIGLTSEQEKALSSNTLALSMNVKQLIAEALACSGDKTKC
jgi:hypothetical protein